MLFLFFTSKYITLVICVRVWCYASLALSCEESHSSWVYRHEILIVSISSTSVPVMQFVVSCTVTKVVRLLQYLLNLRWNPIVWHFWWKLLSGNFLCCCCLLSYKVAVPFESEILLRGYSSESLSSIFICYCLLCCCTRCAVQLLSLRMKF